MGLTQISTGGVKNDAVTAGKIPADAVGQSEIADESVDEARLQVSNAGTNGQFLSKQSGNTGGLTWADVTIPDADKCIEGNTSVEAVDTGSDGHVKITTEGTERVKVDSSGNVGIGTSSPNSYSNYTTVTVNGTTGGQLDIESNGTKYGDIYTQSNAFHVRNKQASGSGFLAFHTTGSGTCSERFRVGSAGQLGVGGATYGTSGQVLTSGGASAAPSWTTISAAPEVELTASGSISNNQAVMVQSNGTAKAVASSTGVANPPVVNSLSLVDGSNAYNMDICYDASIDRVIMYWRSEEYSNRPYAVVGEINSNGTITWGTPAYTETGDRAEGTIQSFGNGKVMVVHKYGWSDNQDIKVQIGVVNASAKTISWGSESTIGTGDEPRTCLINSTHVFVTWRQQNAQNGMMCKIIEQTGTNGISQGNQLNGGWTSFYMGGSHAKPTYNSSTNKVVITWRDANSYLKGLVGTINISNKSISWGSANSINSGQPNYTDNVWINDTTFVTILRSNTHNSGKYCVGTLTGNNISWGTDTQWLSSAPIMPTCEWFADQSRIVVVYRNGSDNKLRLRMGSYSSGSITWGTEVQIPNNNGTSEHHEFKLDDEGRALVASTDESQTSVYATTVDLTVTTTDADKFIGFSTAAYSNGQTAKIAVVGNTTTQSSLTPGSKYYVQKNGTLSTTADTPSIEAGRALSSTKLLIKG